MHMIQYTGGYRAIFQPVNMALRDLEAIGLEKTEERQRESVMGQWLVSLPKVCTTSYSIVFDQDLAKLYKSCRDHALQVLTVPE